MSIEVIVVGFIGWLFAVWFWFEWGRAIRRQQKLLDAWEEGDKRYQEILRKIGYTLIEAEQIVNQIK